MAGAIMNRAMGKSLVRRYGPGAHKPRPLNPNPPRRVLDPATGELAELRAGRRTGHAVVTVTRAGDTRRYRVTLRRYAALREWTLTRGCTSGSWLRNGMTVFLWTGTRRVPAPVARRRRLSREERGPLPIRFSLLKTVSRLSCYHGSAHAAHQALERHLGRLWAVALTSECKSVASLRWAFWYSVSMSLARRAREARP
jgi:hypothetical protein